MRITPQGIVVTQTKKASSRTKGKGDALARGLTKIAGRKRTRPTPATARAQVGTGDRSERIRTYNFNEGRVTDHRIGKTIYAIDAFVDGDMDDIIDPLIYADQQ